MTARTINGVRLTDGERGAYGKGADRARKSYMRKHGSPAMTVDDGARVVTVGASAPTVNGRGKSTPTTSIRAAWASDAARDAAAAALAEHAAAWERTHRAAYERAAARGGESAVKSLHARHGKALADAVAREVCPASGAELAALTAAADAAADRLAVLGLTTRTRAAKPAAPVDVAPVAEPAAPVADIVDAGIASGRVILASVTPIAAAKPAADVAPATVPAPMPAMTRAARKASNRDLAAAMRAAGIAITPDTWNAAKRGELAGLGLTYGGAR